MLNLIGGVPEIIASQTPILIGCIVIGWLSVALMQLIVLSQGIKIYKTKSTASFSVWTFVIFGISSLIGAAWAYCYYIKQVCSDLGVGAIAPGVGDQDLLNALMPFAQWSVVPLVFYNIFNIFCAIWITILKTRNMNLAKKMRCSELELSKALLDKQKKELVASGYKLHKRKYFVLVLILFCAYLVSILVSVLTCLFLVPKDANHLFKFTDAGGHAFFFWDRGLMIISIITSCANEGFGWPTFITVLRKRDTSSLSTNWAIFVPVTLTVSFLYALVLATAEVAAGGWESFPPDTIGALVFNGLIVNYGTLLIKLKNRKTAKKLHMSEETYTKKILVPEYERKIEARKEVERLIKAQEEKIVQRQSNLDKIKKENERREIYQEKRLQEEQNKLQQMKKKAEMKKKEEEIFKSTDKKSK